MNDQKENKTSKWRKIRLEKIRNVLDPPADLAEENKDDSKEEHLVIIEMRAWITDNLKEDTMVIQIVAWITNESTKTW
jgi:hypothetical protein